MKFIYEFLRFLKFQKKLWLAPIIFIIIFIILLLVVAQNSILAPFIYTVF